MSTTTTRNGKVQAILRMKPETYEAIRRAAGRRGRSFNTFAVETLETAVLPQPVKKIKISDFKPDPELERFIVPSFDLTAEDLAEHPRLAKLLNV